MAAAFLAMMVASDYKLRVRSVEQTVGGRPDLWVLFEIAVYGTVAAYLLVRSGRPPRLRRTTRTMGLGAALVVVLCVSALYSPYPSLGSVRAAQLLVVFGVASGAVRYADREAMQGLAHAFIVLVTGSVLFGAAFPFPRFPLQQDRFNWLYVHPVIAGIYLGVAVVLLATYLLAPRSSWPGPHWRPPVYAALLAVCVAALLATQTRGAVVAAVLGVGAAAWSSRSGRRKLDVVFVWACLAVTLVFAARPLVVSFFERGDSTAQLLTLNSRTNLWTEAAGFIAQQPLFGWGLGASRGLFLETLGLGGGHNALVNVLVDAGLVGAAVWLLLLGAIVAALVRMRDLPEGAGVERSALVGLMTFLVVNSAFTEGLSVPATVASLWLYAVLAWTNLLLQEQAALRAVDALRRS